MKLSLDRANAVVNELVTKYAVAANQMMPKGVASLSQFQPMTQKKEEK